MTPQQFYDKWLKIEVAETCTKEQIDQRNDFLKMCKSIEITDLLRQDGIGIKIKE